MITRTFLIPEAAPGAAASPALENREERSTIINILSILTVLIELERILIDYTGLFGDPVPVI